MTAEWAAAALMRGWQEWTEYGSEEDWLMQADANNETWVINHLYVSLRDALDRVAAAPCCLALDLDTSPDALERAARAALGALRRPITGGVNNHPGP